MQVGEAPNSQIAKASGVETDEHGYIKIDIHQQTNLPGVFAAGDVTNHPVKQVGTAVGQGITAAWKPTVTLDDRITKNREKGLYHSKTLFMFSISLS